MNIGVQKCKLDKMQSLTYQIDKGNDAQSW